MAIQAYFDESGVSGTDPVFVLAGFLGYAEKWAHFSDAWKHHLRESPSIRYLKMNDAVRLKGEFCSWTTEERDRKLLGCVQVFHQFKPEKGIYLLNDLIAWKQIIRG